MSLYATAVKKPVTTALVFVAVVIMGLFSLTRLSVDLFPEIETNMIMVMTAYPGASASDIEMNVSKPLENVLNSVSDLKHITSQSRETSLSYSRIRIRDRYRRGNQRRSRQVGRRGVVPSR